LVSFVLAQLGVAHVHLSDWLVKKDSILSLLSQPLLQLRTSYLNSPVNIGLASGFIAYLAIEMIVNRSRDC
jgi:hypothetical protein